MISRIQTTLAIMLVGCVPLWADGMGGMDMGGSQASVTASASTSPPKTAKSVTHRAHGVIKEIKDNGSVLVIKHGAIAGYMDAMTMPFSLTDSAMAKDLKVGDKVDFTLTQSGNFWPITEIHKVAQKHAQPTPTAKP